MPDYHRASSANTAPTAIAMSERARTMIVTGASSGIGRALALAAAGAGYHVVLSARRSALLDEIAGTIRASGGASITLAGDITTPEMKRAWQEGRKELFYPYGKTYAQTIHEQD